MNLKRENKPNDIITVLKTISHRMTLQRAHGPDLPGFYNQRIAAATARFETAVANLKNQRAQLKQVRQSFRTEKTVLRDMLRDGFHNIRRVAAKTEAPSVLHLAFGLLANGTYPKDMRNIPDPIAVASEMIRTHAELVGEGEAMLVFPTVAALQAQLDQVVALNTAHETALVNEQGALEALRKERGEVEKLLLSIKGYLRSEARDLSAVEQRQIMRRYGFKYRGDRADEDGDDAAGEQPDDAAGEQPDDAAADQSEGGNPATDADTQGGDLAQSA